MDNNGQAKGNPAPRLDKLAACWRDGDYEGILQTPLTNLGCTMIGDIPVEDFMVALAQHCPQALLHAYPVAALRIAYILIATDEMAPARRLLQSIKAGLEMLEEGTDKTALLGDYLLVESFLFFPQLDKMLAGLERAARLLPGESRVMAPTEPFCLGIQGVTGALHAQMGRADETAALLERYVACYSSLVKGGGRGADVLMQAELAFYRGDMRAAELLCYKAVYEAEYARQDTVWMGAQYLLAQVAIYQGSQEAFLRAMAGMKRAAVINPENAALCGRLLDYSEGLIYAELGQPDRVAPWVFQEESICHTAIVQPTG